MDKLLLEIGTEEIPAGYIEPALNALTSILLKKLSGARIAHGDAKVFGTPRRLAIQISDVEDRQESLTEEITGPPEKVAFDGQGKPLVAAQKFAEKLGIPIEQIKIKETEKGRYLCAEKTDAGLPTVDFLANILPDMITEIPFPKTMKWADLHIQFARPVRSVLAILGSRVIPFALGNIQSSNTVSGHRFMQPDKITIHTPDEYVGRLRGAYVMADLAERRKAVEEEVAKAAAALGGKVLPDSGLTDIVKNLVEYPVAVVGKFDREFLEVPDEVLITAMRKHQKYFAVVDDKNKLMPCFIAVNNTLAKDMSLAAAGHERVLRARLSDAQFFYRSDLESSFEAWVEKLQGLLFQAKLGTMYEKMLRVRELAEAVSDMAEQSEDVKQDASRAATLCKADLVSQVVVEFPELQGVMGRVYAGVRGENTAVASAVEEHYRPTYSGGPLPETITGAILAVADKADSICGCFKAGLIPTGASDPYALRRQGIGIVQIMLDKGFSFSLMLLIEKSLSLFGEISVRDMREISTKIYTFLQNRMEHLLAEQGFSKDVIAAVTSVSVDNVPHLWERVRALEKLKSAPDFEPIAVAFKRVVNIIRKAEYLVSGVVDESLFGHETERQLFAACKEVKNKVADDMRKGQFEQALLDIASLRPAVDAFFNDVLVMAEDEKIRDNRLVLLKHIVNLFENYADFSKISV